MKSTTTDNIATYYALTKPTPYATNTRSLRGVAQLVARVLWEHEVAGSNPVTPTTLLLSLF